jgi:hypothetical protein
MNRIVKARCQHRRQATEPSVSQCEPQRVITAAPVQGGAHCCWSRYICWASLALGPLAGVRVCFHQMWPWCWRIVVVLADDLAMACHAPTVGANVDPQRGTPPLALDPSRRLPFASAKVFENLSALEG